MFIEIPNLEEKNIKKIKVQRSIESDNRSYNRKNKSKMSITNCAP